MSGKMQKAYKILCMKDRMIALGLTPLAWLCGVTLRLMGYPEEDLERVLI